MYVGDVAHCFAPPVDERDDSSALRAGRTVYTLRELVAWVAETTGHVRPIIGLGPTLSALQARALERCRSS